MNDSSSNDFNPSIRPLPANLPVRAGDSPRVNIGTYEHGEYQINGDRSFTYYLEIVAKHFWLFCGIFLGAVVAIGLYTYFSTRLFTATVSLKIGTYSPALTGDGIEGVLRAKTLETDYLNTQVEQLSSLSLADKVLSDTDVGAQINNYNLTLAGKQPTESAPSQNLTADPESTYHFPLRKLRSYLSLIAVEPVFKTSVVRVSATMADPVLAARVANAHSKAFIELSRVERQKTTLDNLLFLKGQAAELEEKVAQSERSIAAYAEENAIITLDSNENLVVKQMSETNRMLTEATARRVNSEAALNQAKSGAGLSTTQLADRAIEGLRTALKDSEAEYAMLSEKFQPSYPKMIQLAARIKDLKGNLEKERGNVTQALEATYNADAAAEKDLKGQLEKLKENAYSVSRKQVQFNILKREYDSLKDLHQSVLRQLKEVQMSAENRNSNIIISDLAAVPDRPSQPRVMINMLLGSAFGFVVAFLTVLFMETMHHSLKDADDVHESLGLPALGTVPVFEERYIENPIASGLLSAPGDSMQAEPKGPTPDQGAEESSAEALPAAATVIPPISTSSSTLIAVKAPRSLAAEAFQTIRTGLLLSSPDSPPKVVLITSSLPGEGKTTVASNLSVTLAEGSSKTIIIDCDLRKSSLHKRFGIDSKLPGLVDFLSGQKNIEDCVFETEVNNLHVMCAGSRTPNPAAILSSKKMGELIAKLSETYDYVLLDSPPILPVSDALLVSRHGAAVILVTHGKKTNKRQVQDATRRLRQARALILGVVINHSRARSSELYYGNYYNDETYEVSA